MGGWKGGGVGGFNSVNGCNGDGVGGCSTVERVGGWGGDGVGGCTNGGGGSICGCR